MKTRRIVIAAVVVLGIVGGCWIKWREDQRVMSNARSALMFAQYERPQYADASKLQFTIRDLEKCEEELRGAWFVSGSEKRELQGQLSERRAQLTHALAQAIQRLRA